MSDCESVVERVAKALYESDGFNVACKPTAEAWPMDREKVREDYRRKARAAISAMREPTDDMLKAGAVGSGEDSTGVALGAYQNMIDAALKPVGE